MRTNNADPAAIFAAAESLYRNGEITAGIRNVDNSYSPLQYPLVDLSDAYDGGDNFMRECMRVATLFEEWACYKVDWDANMEVWPYLLEEQFGKAVYQHQGNITSLASFTRADCRPVALIMGITLLPHTRKAVV